jgi:hypothetical protein
MTGPLVRLQSSQRRVSLAPVFEQRRRWTASAACVRLVQVLAGTAVLLLPSRHIVIVVVLLVVGVVAAVVSPARNGQAAALLGGVLGWLFSDGLAGSPSLPRVLMFAVALFVLHDSTSLAAAVPMTCQLRPEAMLGWLRRSLLALLGAGLLAAITLGVGAIVQGSTSAPLQLVGSAGVLALLGVTAWLYTRSLRS